MSAHLNKQISFIDLCEILLDRGRVSSIFRPEIMNIQSGRYHRVQRDISEPVNSGNLLGVRRSCPGLNARDSFDRAIIERRWKRSCTLHGFPRRNSKIASKIFRGLEGLRGGTGTREIRWKILLTCAGSRPEKTEIGGGFLITCSPVQTSTGAPGARVPPRNSIDLSPPTAND